MKKVFADRGKLFLPVIKVTFAELVKFFISQDASLKIMSNRSKQLLKRPLPLYLDGTSCH